MKTNTYGIDSKKGVLNRGNLYRMARVMEKALGGEPVTIGFLGGSITQGCLSSTPRTCYAYLVCQWWRDTFPESQITYLTARIGGPTSQFGVASADSDLLSGKADFSIVEFSFNDDDNEHFLETYEGLIRKLYKSKTRPAVLIVNSVRYDNGENAQEQHLKVGRAYHIPCVSMKPCLYEKVLDGTFTSRDITEDDLHPNDLGHSLMAEVIIDFLEGVYEHLKDMPDPASEADVEIDKLIPISANSYENSVRYQNYNCREILTENNGFTADLTPQNNIREIFRHGWTADKQGARISFCVEGSCIGVQYRKSIHKPAPVATAIIDGCLEQAVVLDANFDETWGDSLHLDTLAEHLPYGKHTIEIELTETHENDKVPFYLVSVIV
ncbi:MAG: SGNH/GDSL hydrolase family protein [Lachnospiraceae bacterium]|nr:SGNH/GDSL hydrolase family protein [Lachnospiraceae bacterium]